LQVTQPFLLLGVDARFLAVVGIISLRNQAYKTARRITERMDDGREIKYQKDLGMEMLGCVVNDFQHHIKPVLTSPAGFWNERSSEGPTRTNLPVQSQGHLCHAEDTA
jgi:hypothetical protein